ncbi:MAG: PQQ-binding-like beta-propeller repeat protein, partial [Planctomycetes bacterium]|nr:PQQ-binding-like beta-propeller repeat protein [Planctomycetota bacterium]
PADGSLIWQVSYASETTSEHGTGMRATPYIEEERVYTFGRGGELGCWNLLDGAEIWRRNVEADGGESPRWGHSSSPLVVGEKVVVQGGGRARAIAYNKMSGELEWKSGEGLAGYAPIVVTEVDEKLVLLVFHGEGLAALEVANGNELWDIEWETPWDVNAGTPIVVGDEVFITSGYGVGGSLLKMGAEGASKVWENTVISAQHTDPYIIDGFLYGYSGDSSQNRGSFKCVELGSGEEVWSTNEMGWGTCLWVDGYLLCCDIKGNVYLMKPGAEKFELVTEMREALGKVRGPVWTIPVVSNGKLYLRFKQRMVCYDLQEEF